MKIAKKLLVCGLSLTLVSSTGLTNVSAHRIHTHHHIRVSRVIKRHHNYRNSLRLGSNISNSDNLSVHQIIQLMNQDYYLECHHNKYSFNDYLHLDNKYGKFISIALEHNWQNYSIKQLKHIQNNKDTNNLKFFNQDEDINLAIGKVIFNRTHDVNQITSQDNSFDTELRSNLINDINNTRASYGLNPLTVNYVMQATANYRIPHIQYAYDHFNDYLNYPHTSNPQDDWIHGVDTNTTSSEYFKKHHYNVQYSSENATNWSSNINENGDGTPTEYLEDTPEHVAKNTDDGIINHDNCLGNNNGHRDNELNPKYQYLGVGVHFNPNTNQGVIDEEFSN